jgi:hypothetical protein
MVKHTYEGVFGRYSEFRPTPHDGHIEMDDREHWFVMPVSQTRDSDILTKSNFDAFLKELGGESRSVEVHRFGHWGPGWFEIIIVSPRAAMRLQKAYDMARALDDYPILDEEDYLRQQHEDEIESWDNYGAGDFSRMIERLLDTELAESDVHEPTDPNQRWCKNSGMDIDVCCCGDCIETREEWIVGLKEKLDSLTSEQLRSLADDLGMDVEHSSEGTHFRHKKDMDSSKAIELLDQLKSEGQVTA